MRTVGISIPPNPAVGGSLLAIAEQRLMGEVNFEIRLMCDEPNRRISDDLVELMLGVEGCRSVTVEIEEADQNLTASGRFESPYGLTQLGTPEAIRECIQFSAQVHARVVKKIPTRRVDDIVTVHLNTVVGRGAWARSQLNSNEAATFLTAVKEIFKGAKILVIGRDADQLGLQGLPDECWVATRLDLSLLEQLAVVQRSAAFVGMSSGPSVAAILSNVPYLIIKHKTHHEDLMSLLLDDTARLPFASKHQKFHIASDSFLNALKHLQPQLRDLAKEIQLVA